jgi:general secretion pathway protein M
MKQLEGLTSWYRGLQQRERQLVLAATIIITITLLYLVIWEPMHKGLEEQTQKYQAQLEIREWMQAASIEARTLQASGVSNQTANRTQPVTLLVENSATTAGLKPFMSKLESTSDKGARVTLDAASFDQMLLWLNTLQTQYGITVSSANLDRDDKPGTVNVRMTLNRD